MRGNPPEAVLPVPAATVVLVREQDRRLQVLLLQRSADSRFMGGAYVFPGGRVEPADESADWWRPHVDLEPDLIFRRLGGDGTIGEAFAAAVAAVRESFEEAGVLLARSPAFSAGELQQVRGRHLAGAFSTGWFQELAEKTGLIIQLSRLFRWSRWITPAQMPYRYDTRFFAARMPKDQVGVPDMQETVQALWIRPEEALERNLRGEIPLSPPTLITLHEMLSYDRVQDFEEAAAKRRWGSPRKPRLVSGGREMLIIEPWDPEYHRSKIRIDVADLRAGIAPVGTAFSRLWFSAGSWKPVTY